MDSDQKDISAILRRVDTTDCPHCHDPVHVGELEPFSQAECPHCGKPFTVPAKLGPFLLVGVIGTGGMGGVYHAVDQSLGRSVAIKVMLSSLGDDQDFVETFRREAQAAAKLNHPHIAQIYSFGQEQGQPYIVMELVTGRGLDKLIESGEPLDQGLILRIALDISEGLNEADQIGLQHGDIKPENILLNEKMDAKLIDFGIASYGGQNASEGIWGTPYYIAPEKLRRQTVDARSDIYSLGATLYHALCGHPPFEGETPIEVVKARLEQEPPPLSERREDIHPDLERIIMRMLRMDPASRYPTYTSLISDMRKVVEQVKPEHETSLKSKRIRIRKKTSGNITVPGGASTTGSRPTVSAKGKGASGSKKKTLTEEDKRRRSALKKKLIWGVIGLVVVAAAVGTGVMVKIRRNREITARRYYLALTSAREEAANTYEAVELAVTNIATRAAAVEPVIATVADAVEVVTQASSADLIEWVEKNSPVFDPDAVDAEDEPEDPVVDASPPTNAVPASDAPASTNAVATPTNDAATAAETPTGEEAAEAEPGEAAGHEANGEEQEGAESETPPAGEPAAESEAQAEPTAEDGETTTGDAEPPPTPTAEPPRNEPEIRILARDALSKVVTVRTHAVEAREIGVRAARLQDEAGSSREPTIVASKAAALNDLLEILDEKKDEIRKAIDHAESIVKRMTVIKTRTLRRRAEEEEARIEQEKERQAELARQRREEAHQARVDEEIQRIRSAVEEVKPLLNQHQYSVAKRNLSDKIRNLETDEAKAQLQVHLDRFQYLEDLKAFFIQQLEDDPFKWGWIQGASPEDILGANIGFVKLRGRVIPWKEVSTRQMVHFIRHYITRANRSVPLSELGEKALGAAIFAYENGGYQWAADYKEQAVRFSPRLRTDAERLVPDEPPPGEGS